tara:strand:- start:522 stop:710 length:189 start_codon:yes stop_codon:yes gene_type:complete
MYNWLLSILGLDIQDTGSYLNPADPVSRPIPPTREQRREAEKLRQLHESRMRLTNSGKFDNL